MPSYDFKSLSPHDFETLSRDLLQASEGIVLESFKSGADQGIDFRFSKGRKKTIVQCKHYVGSGYNKLYSELKKEAVKAKKLKPKRYVLTTSVALSPKNKANIKALFGKVLSTADIFGKDDLNNLLTIHDDIHKKNYKLWLTSTVVLENVLNNAEYTQSDFEVEKIHTNIRKYVSSSAYPKAEKILEVEKALIVSGQPGVGKTTLAKMLLYAHLEKKYQVISIAESFEEARKLIKKDKKQIFYFDDFLGATFLGEAGATLQVHKDNQILDFVDMVKKTKKKRLILTTREHIFQQAHELSEKLGNSEIIDKKYILEMSDYSLLQKAEILYNHLYFSELPSPYLQKILDDDFYISIVRHENFNPRLIDWMTNFQRVKKVDVDDYDDYILNLLGNPIKIWQFAYRKQISKPAQALLLALYTTTSGTSVKELGEIFKRLNKYRSTKYNYPTKPSDFTTALKEINQSFVVVEDGDVNFLDPSLYDFIFSELISAPENIIDIWNSVLSLSHVARVWNVAVSDEAGLLVESLKSSMNFLESNIANFFDAKTNYGSYMSYEKKLELICHISDKTHSKKIRKFLKSRVLNLPNRWQGTSASIRGALKLFDTIDKSGWAVKPLPDNYSSNLKSSLFKNSIDDGLDLDDLEQLNNYFHFDDLTNKNQKNLQSCFQNYLNSQFSSDLSDVDDIYDIESMIYTLNELESNWGVDAFFEIDQAEELKSELEEKESEENDEDEDDDDDDEDEAPELDESDDDIRNMFGSLS